MCRFLASLLLGLVVAIAEANSQSGCELSSEFKGSKQPSVLAMLERLKGGVAMYGDNVCSGALVTFTERPSSAPALVLSAAHCSNRGKAQIQLQKGSLAALDAGEVLYRAEYRRPLTLDTGKSDEPRSCVQAVEMVYGTLTGGDIMLLRLSETYEEIERRTGVKPFLLSQDTSFPPGLALRMPSSFWQNDRACAIDGVAEKVNEFRWSWGPVLRLRLDVDTCLFPHGASGSPAIRADTNEVIGVAGTASDGDGGPCELNNPCEVNADGSTKVAPKDQAYVHFIHQFYSCLDAARDVDLAAPGCALPKPR